MRQQKWPKKSSKRSSRISASFTATLRACTLSAARSALKSARPAEQVAALLGCDPSEIIFTGCGTESDNTAIKGTLPLHPNKRKIITTRVEHPAVLSVCRDSKTTATPLSNYRSIDKAGSI